MSPIYRAEAHLLSFGAEAADGTDPGTSVLTFPPGVWETATLPDWEADFLPKWYLGSASLRNWYSIFRGKKILSGSIPDMLVLNGSIFKWGLGSVTTEGTDVGGGGGGVIDTGAVLKGATTVNTSLIANYTANDFVQIGTVTTGVGANAEARRITTVNVHGDGTGDLVLNYPLSFAHALGETLNEVTVPYTHRVLETNVLDTMTMHVTYEDSEQTAANRFMRRWHGGKVNRMSFKGDEGEPLRVSWDEILFRDLSHNQRFHSAIGGGAANITKYAAGVAQPTVMNHLLTPAYPITEPYYFSQANLTLFGVTFARLRHFLLEANNNIEARYYIQDNSGAGQIPAATQEHRKEYRLAATIAMPDAVAAATSTVRTMFKELLLEGNYTAGFTGFDISLVFTRGASDTITFTIPPSAAATGGDAQGAFIRAAKHNIVTESPVQVDVEAIFRSMRVTIVDSLAEYP